MIWLWLACSVAGPDGLAEDASVPLEQALSACGTHPDPDLAGKCMMNSLKARDLLETARCGVVTGRWRGLCVLEKGERSNGSLKGRYKKCAQSTTDERDCRFQLWQADVMALEPGHPDHALELEGMREVVKRHHFLASDTNPNISDDMWTWFWGAWWEQRESQQPTGRDPARCEGFLSPLDVRLCKKWAPEASEWSKTRVPASDGGLMPPGAPGGPEATSP